MHLRILHVVAGIKGSDGGLAVSVPRLCEATADLGLQVGVVSQRNGGSLGDYLMPEPTKVSTMLSRQFRLMGRDIAYSPFFSEALRNECINRSAQVIHSHGLWLPCNHSAARCAKKLGIPLVVHPRGMIEPWALGHRAWKKRLAWELYQKRDLETATIFIATSRQEALSIRAAGLRQPIAIIPNGVDLPVLNCGAPRQESVRTALFLSRIHLKKGLLNLVSAWAAVNPEGWRMVIAGPDENGHRREVELAVRDAGLVDSFQFIGPVAGESKDSIYRSAALFVLPTFSENFGNVIAEALSYGVPVITTRGAPWESLITHDCGWWTEIGVEPLAEAVREATGLSDSERQAMGLNGRKLVSERFSWGKIGFQMRSVYEWILRGGPPPSCVIIG